MYGTTMKNYNSSKLYREDNMSQKIKKAPKTRKEETPRTRYMKINERRVETKHESSVNNDIVRESFSKKEFPIASVIFTAIATMVLLLLTTGVLG